MIFYTWLIIITYFRIFYKAFLTKFYKLLDHTYPYLKHLKVFRKTLIRKHFTWLLNTDTQEILKDAANDILLYAKNKIQNLYRKYTQNS